MVENLRKAEFDAAQPVRNKETGEWAIYHAKSSFCGRFCDHVS
jgi:hypothetical protein